MLSTISSITQCYQLTQYFANCCKQKERRRHFSLMRLSSFLTFCFFCMCCGFMPYIPAIMGPGKMDGLNGPVGFIKSLLQGIPPGRNSQDTPTVSKQLLPLLGRTGMKDIDICMLPDSDKPIITDLFIGPGNHQRPSQHKLYGSAPHRLLRGQLPLAAANITLAGRSADAAAQPDIPDHQSVHYTPELWARQL